MFNGATRTSANRSAHGATAVGIGFALTVLLSGAPGAGAQSVPVTGGGFPVEPSAPVDSAELFDRARDAQRRFERVRTRHLPWAWSSWGGPCEERVGRMCWHHDDPEDDWERPDDPQALIEARATLLDTLGALGAALPEDRWILGQRVWYLGEDGRWADAAALTAGCQGTAVAWCSALRGLSLHQLGRYSEAATAFDQAGGIVEELGGDEEEAFRMLLDRDSRGLLDREESAPGALLPLDSLLWVLSDPMYLVPGNDRRTEHAARRVVNRIRDRARNPYSLSWGRDLSELGVRYGWAVAWERVRGGTTRSQPVSIIGHHLPKARGFIPDGSLLGEPADGNADELRPVADRPRTSYRPLYAEVIRPGEGEVFAFDRGDSLVFIGALTDDLPDSVAHQAGAFAADLTSGVVSAGESAGPQAWVLRAPNRPQVVSLEWLPDSVAEARRHRRTFDRIDRPAGLVALSELIVLKAGAQPATVEEAAADLRSARIAPGETVTAAWEVYGLGFDEAPMQYRVMVGKKREGILAAVGDWIGVGDGDDGLLIDWVENQPEDPGPLLRFVSITFPELEEGTYQLRLSLQMPGRAEVVQEREFEVSKTRRNP